MAGRKQKGVHQEMKEVRIWGGGGVEETKKIGQRLKKERNVVLTDGQALATE
jgi:hypothetical protein